MSFAHAHQLSTCMSIIITMAFRDLFPPHRGRGVFGGSLDNLIVGCPPQTLLGVSHGARGCDVLIIVPIKAFLLLQLHRSVYGRTGGCSLLRVVASTLPVRPLSIPCSQRPASPLPVPSTASNPRTPQQAERAGGESGGGTRGDRPGDGELVRG